MQPLGGLVSTHPVANSRRWVAGLGALLIVVAAAGLLVFLIANPWGSRNFGAAMAYTLIPIAVVLPIACVQLVKAVRGVGESFEVYERGLAHVALGRRRDWTWEQVVAFEVKQKGGRTGFGWDFGCAVRFRGGVRLQFNGLTRDARGLADALGRRCPAAAGKATRTRDLENLLWLTPLGAIGFGWAMWWAATYIMTNDDQSDRGGPGYIEGVEPLADSALAGLAALILVSLIGFIACAVTAIAFIPDRVRGR